MHVLYMYRVCMLILYTSYKSVGLGLSLNVIMTVIKGGEGLRCVMLTIIR